MIHKELRTKPPQNLLVNGHVKAFLCNLPACIEDFGQWIRPPWIEKIEKNG